MAYSAAARVALIVICLVASWLFAGLRYYVRLRILKRLYWDDLFALLALFALTVDSVTFLIAVLYHGLGQHTADVKSIMDISQAIKDLFIMDNSFVFGSAFIKISFALTLHRVVLLKLHLYTLYFIMIITTVTTIVTFRYIAFACSPISYYWTKVLDPSGGSCISIDVQLKESYGHGAVMLFGDLVLGLVIPIHLLCKLQMQTAVKVSAALLLSLGSVASVATIIRIIYTLNTNYEDFLFSINQPTLWATIELAVSIVGTSASTLKPLLAYFKMFRGSGYGGQHTDLELDSRMAWSNSRTKVVISGPERSLKTGGVSSSTEEITWDGKDVAPMGIQRTVQFQTSTARNNNTTWME